MAQRLGPLFLRSAFGPVNYAGSCIMARQVVIGLRELTAENLMSALRRGVGNVARESGVRPQDVERFLPLDEMSKLAAELDAAAKRALDVWSRYASHHIAGLLEGVTDLTIDGRPPDLSLCLMRLSRKVKADREWSKPLAALADLAERWTDQLRECRELVDGGEALARAHQRRRKLRLALLVSATSSLALTLVISIWMVLHIRAARARIAEQITAGGICDWNEIAEGDRDHSTEEQTRTIEEQVHACAERRDRERKEAEARARIEAEARERDRLKRERDAQCSSLSDAVAKAKLEPAHEATAGRHADLLRRVSAGKLDRTDVAWKLSELPCADTPSAARLEAAYGKALLASPSAWIYADDVSADVARLIAARRDELKARHRSLVALNAEQKAKRALVKGQGPEVDRALRLCAFKRQLEFLKGDYCEALERTQERKQKK